MTLLAPNHNFEILVHRIVNWPDSRITDIRLFKKFIIRLAAGYPVLGNFYICS